MNMRKRSYSRLDLAALVILILALAIGPVMSAAAAAPGNSGNTPGRTKSAFVEVSPLEEVQQESMIEDPVPVEPEEPEEPGEPGEPEEPEEPAEPEEPEAETPSEENTDPQEKLPLEDPEVLLDEGELQFMTFAAEALGEPTYTEEWDGRGTNSKRCDLADGNLRPETGWIHWVFSTKGASTDAKLIINGTDEYTPGPPLTAEVWHFYTPYYELDDLTALIYLYGGLPGPGGGLVISDYCPGLTGCLKIVKEWQGYDNVAGFDAESMIPQSIQVRIDGPAFGAEGKTVTLYKSEEWEYVECGLKLGDYTVTELFNDNKWNTVVNPVMVTVVAGKTSEEAVVVTVTNTFRPGCLKLTKDWKYRDVEGYENINLPRSIEVIVTGPSFPDGKTFVLKSWDKWRLTICKLVPGDYTVKEVPIEGWKTTMKPKSGTVTVAPGSNPWNAAKVELTNTFITGCLKISKAWLYKDVVGFDPDTMIPDKIEVKVTGPSYPEGKVFELTKASGWNLTLCKLIPGNYEVEEVDSECLEGWKTSYWPVSGKNEVKPGSTAYKAAQVKIINKFETGCLEINKEFVFGDIEGFDFDITEITVKIVGPSFPAPGETFTINIGEDGTGSRTWCKLIPGNYTVTEESVGPEWMVVISGDGEVTVEAMCKAVVDITNTYIQCYKDETAWAVGNIGFIENLNLKNWGWSNQIGKGTHYRDLYAGAGQNDINKGELVGKVKIVYDEAGCVTVTYLMKPGVQLLEAHVWIDGSDPLPFRMRGSDKIYNSAPGQLGFEAGVKYCGFTGDIYVAAHGVARIPVVCPEQ
jgi:hypothetical protein